MFRTEQYAVYYETSIVCFTLYMYSINVHQKLEKSDKKGDKVLIYGIIFTSGVTNCS